MKTLISASILAIGLFAGTANAAQGVRRHQCHGAPRTVRRHQRHGSPRQRVRGHQCHRAALDVFQDIQDTAPRSDGVYGDLETRAP